MKRIGILSDTHSTLPSQVYTFFKDCDELWHAGDIGFGVLDKLREFKPVRAVWGNCDSFSLHYELPEVDFFECEGCRVLMTHIAGTPGHYTPEIQRQIELAEPDIFVCGHSHILLVASSEFRVRNSASSEFGVQSSELKLPHPDNSELRTPLSAFSTHKFLHINPGAAGRQGFHARATLVRLTIADGHPGDVEYIDFSKNPLHTTQP